MEPISLIIAALVSGMLRAVTRSAQDVIYEGYLDLKSAILTRHADQGGPALVQATKALEEQPNAELRPAVLPMELERVGADQDPHLLHLANRLTSLIEDPMQRFDNPTEQAHYAAGVRAVAKVMNRHVAGLVRVRREFTLEDTVLLTASAGQARDVPREVSDRATASRHQRQRAKSLLRAHPWRWPDRDHRLRPRPGAR